MVPVRRTEYRRMEEESASKIDPYRSCSEVRLYGSDIVTYSQEA